MVTKPLANNSFSRFTMGRPSRSSELKQLKVSSFFFQVHAYAIGKVI
jgi:hypothetical protein